MHRETIYALTSLSPAARNAATQKACIDSWRSAGLEVRAFNHPSEIAALARQYQVEFVPVQATSADVFGRHYVPIKRILDWAGEQDAPVLLINSDIQLRLSPWEVKRARWLSDGGLCFVVRYNHDGNVARAKREPFGMDAFLMSGRDATLFPDSFMSMGQPWWDYWVPHTFIAHGRPVRSIEHPAAFHRNHQQQWSWQAWHRCGLEFDRMSPSLGADRSYDACMTVARATRESIDRARVPLLPKPPGIRAWVEQRFRHRGPKVFLELGAHQGTDTVWLAALPEVTMHAFEPDPRNHPPGLPNVVMQRAAIADSDGRAPFILSDRGWGQQEWTYSSSLKRPTNHLIHYPVSFGETIEVETVTLDAYCRAHDIGTIDFIWADIQGAEGEMIRGGRETLKRTRYLYTEYSDEEMYDGQVTLREIMTLLPDFRVLELWPDEVLLENRSFAE